VSWLIEKQLRNYEENHCLRHTNYEIRMLYPVIHKYTSLPLGVKGRRVSPHYKQADIMRQIVTTCIGYEAMSGRSPNLSPLESRFRTGEKRLAMLQRVVLLIFTALASSFLWWRSRFKICRRCRSRIRRWASVCHVCGAEQIE
jgi:hypothetical protein